MTDTSRTTIHTYMGHSIDLAQIDVGDIDTLDIGWSLSGQTRFNGHTNDHQWTVLHHSFLVAEITKYLDYNEEVHRGALLHDAHEAYVGDISTPVKHLLGGEYLALTNRIDAAVIKKYDLANGAFKNPAIRQADQFALAVEAYKLLETKGVPDIVPECFQPVQWATDLFELIRVRPAFGLRAEFHRVFRYAG